MPSGNLPNKSIPPPGDKAQSACTTKPDKYDRYLADFFIHRVMGEGSGANGEELFLNIALLAHGHAVRMNAYSPADWDGG